jgi:hypothetical protein
MAEKKNKPHFLNGARRGGISKGQKQVRTIIRQELGVSTEDQLKTLSLFIKGAGAVRLIRQMQTLHGFKYVMAWQIVAEYVLPKLSRIEVEDNRPPAPTVTNILNVLSGPDKLKLLELMRNNKVTAALSNGIEQTNDIPHEETDANDYSFLD